MLGCTVPVRKAPFLEAQFAHAKVKLEGISSLSAVSRSTGDTNGQTRLEGHRALACGSWRPDGSAEAPGACRDTRCVTSGRMKLGLSVSVRRAGGGLRRGRPDGRRALCPHPIPAPAYTWTGVWGPLPRCPLGCRAGPDLSCPPGSQPRLGPPHLLPKSQGRWGGPALHGAPVPRGGGVGPRAQHRQPLSGVATPHASCSRPLGGP